MDPFEGLEEVVGRAIKETAFAEWDAGDGLVCEVYLEETARRVAAEVRRSWPLREGDEAAMPSGRPSEAGES